MGQTDRTMEDIKKDLRIRQEKQATIREDNLKRELERNAPGEWDDILPEWKVLFLFDHGSVGFYTNDYIALIKQHQDDGLVGIAGIGTIVVRMYPWHEIREIEVYKFRDAEIPEVEEKKPWWHLFKKKRK